MTQPRFEMGETILIRCSDSTYRPSTTVYTDKVEPQGVVADHATLDAVLEQVQTAKVLKHSEELHLLPWADRP